MTEGLSYQHEVTFANSFHQKLSSMYQSYPEEHQKTEHYFPPSNHTANILKTHLSILLPAPQYLPEGLMGQDCFCSQRGHGWGTQCPSQAANTNELKLGLWNSFPWVPPHRGMRRNSLTLINYEGLRKHAECPNAVSMKSLPTQMKPRTT